MSNSIGITTEVAHADKANVRSNESAAHAPSAPKTARDRSTVSRLTSISETSGTGTTRRPECRNEEVVIVRVGKGARSFFSGYTAQQSVEYVAWLSGLSGSTLSSAVRDAQRRVRLEEHRMVPVRKMSGGMRQRVDLAEALVNNPSVLLLDEPTVGLDPAQRAAFRDVLASEKEDRAVLLSTHLTDDVEAVADRVVVVAGDGIHFEGTPRELAQLAGADSVDSRSLEAGYLAAVSAPTPPNG